MNTDDLVRAFLARGGQVTRVPEGERPTNAQLARTPAERFFRSVNRYPLSKRERLEAQSTCRR